MAQLDDIEIPQLHRCLVSPFVIKTGGLVLHTSACGRMSSEQPAQGHPYSDAMANFFRSVLALI